MSWLRKPPGEALPAEVLELLAPRPLLLLLFWLLLPLPLPLVEATPAVA